MAEQELTVEEFVKAVEMLARSLSISMQVLQEKANPILFKQALAVAVGTVVKDDELEEFIEEVREWSGSSVHLLREDEAYQAAIRDARFRHEFELGMPSRTSRAGIGAEESVEGIGTSSTVKERAMGVDEQETVEVVGASATAQMFGREADDRLTLTQADLCFPQKPDNLLRRVSLPCHSLLSSIEVGNSRIRSLSLASPQGSRPFPRQASRGELVRTDRPTLPSGLLRMIEREGYRREFPVIAFPSRGST